ncbi:MAG TPA: hypothetical protein VMU84_14565 [Thermoanaerobaculia bacterium]|nr:hypothetical protein [Thermoanaerobaculia bacterium]
MQKTAVVAGALLLAASGARAGWLSGCDESAPRHVVTPASGITRVVVEARAGSLEIRGQRGLSQITADGTACSSDRDFLKKIDLRLSRSGSELHVDVLIPDHGGFFGNNEARLDLTVNVPAGIPMEIHDSSGWMKVSDIGAATINDSSGEMEVRNVQGNLTVHDSSGEVDIDGVSGDVTIDDSSGAMTIARVSGTVHVEDDGSGSIDIRDVKRDVTIDDDGSGSVRVADVTGNFTLRMKGSGDVDYLRVGGRVSVPRD